MENDTAVVKAGVTHISPERCQKIRKKVTIAGDGIYSYIKVAGYDKFIMVKSEYRVGKLLIPVKILAGMKMGYKHCECILTMTALTVKDIDKYVKDNASAFTKNDKKVLQAFINGNALPDHVADAFLVILENMEDAKVK